MHITQKVFKTYDLGLAASLVSLGFQLTDLEKSNPRKVLFIFQIEEGINEAIGDYWSDNLQINARSHFDNIKMLKNRIYGS